MSIKKTYTHAATYGRRSYKNFLSFERIKLKLKIMVHANV